MQEIKWQQFVVSLPTIEPKNTKHIMYINEMNKKIDVSNQPIGAISKAVHFHHDSQFTLLLINQVCEHHLHQIEELWVQVYYKDQQQCASAPNKHEWNKNWQVASEFGGYTPSLKRTRLLSQQINCEISEIFGFAFSSYQETT